MVYLAASLFFLGIANIAGPTIWVAAQRPDSLEDALLFFARLNIETHQRITALMASGFSFIMLALALFYMPDA